MQLAGTGRRNQNRVHPTAVEKARQLLTNLEG
jgi:hypothetical protein